MVTATWHEVPAGKTIIHGALQGSARRVFRPLVGAPNGEGEKDHLTP